MGFHVGEYSPGSHGIRSGFWRKLQALSRPPSARDLDNLCWALAAVRGFSGGMLTETIQGAERGNCRGSCYTPEI